MRVVDLWVIPDYDAILLPYIDPDFGQYAKRCWTQLQFKFEAVPVSEFFPLGVKTTYRRFSCDEVVVIMSKKSEKCGFIEEWCEVQWFPEAWVQVKPDDPPSRPAGFHILRASPDDDMLHLKAFKVGGHAELQYSLKKIRKTLPDKYHEEWDEFAALAPDSNDIHEYMEKNPSAL